MISPAILHIDTGRTFRGGQRQLLLLSERLGKNEIRQAIACPQDSELFRRIEGIPIVGLSNHSLIRKLFPNTLYGAVRTHGINLIHAHDSEAHTLGVHLKRKYPQVKLIVTRRVIFPPSGALSRRIKYRKYVDCFIAISRAVAESLMKIGIEENRITIIPSALDIESIKNTPADDSVWAHAEAGHGFVIVTAGALTAEKDFATAIRAVSEASRKMDGIQLVILGEGPEREKLKRIISADGLDYIRLMGHCEPMAPIFKACHLFLLTSTSEGLNSSAIEAAACGLPLVVSDVGGLPEIAEHEYNGVLCRPGQPEQFADAIADLLKNEGKRNLMAENSVRKSEQFDIEQAAAKTVGLYHRKLAE
jgi:glycosyltransferase involved in cell wall biosynthesis